MNPAAEPGSAEPVETTPAAPGRESPGEKQWSRSRWLTWVMLIFAAHVGLVFAFGARKPVPPRPATNVPMLALARDAGEWLALNDPTLFAVPHPRDFNPVLRVKTSAFILPSFRWTEPPAWLALAAGSLGTVFGEFMETNRFAGLELQLKPPLTLSAPVLPIEPVLPQASMLQIADGLAQRPLLTPMDLPSWPYADVISPSCVQVLVNAAGEVVSATLLPPDNRSEAASRYDAADQYALAMVRTARFMPAPRLTIGRLIFHWHTVPPPATNAPASTNEPGP
jgi:hypothetical protein